MLIIDNPHVRVLIICVLLGNFHRIQIIILTSKLLDSALPKKSLNQIYYSQDAERQRKFLFYCRIFLIFVDFLSMARLMDTKHYLSHSYVSPEVLQGKPYDESVDMWSIGVILYVVLVGYPPFLEENQEKQSQKIMTANYQFYDDDWRNISQEAQDLIRRLLVIDPGDRLSASQALEHNWIKGETSSTYFGNY